jgi:cytochrome c oxidase subunit 2
MLFNDYPVSGQYYFQDPGTKTFESILDLHDRIMYYLIILLILVLWFFISSFTNSNYINISHGNLIELIWTITPAAILWGIGLPSLRLLYMMDEILDSELTVKAIGSQWFWRAPFNYKEGFSLPAIFPLNMGIKITNLPDTERFMGPQHVSKGLSV